MAFLESKALEGFVFDERPTSLPTWHIDTTQIGPMKTISAYQPKQHDVHWRTWIERDREDKFGKMWEGKRFLELPDDAGN